MDRKILEEYIKKEFSTREIAELTDKSQVTIRYWLKKFELKTKHALYNCKENKCLECGEEDKSKFYPTHKVKCKKCLNKTTTERQRNYKKQFVEYKGGKCEFCGYDKCLAALAFHHRDPKEKDPKWKFLKNYKLEAIKDELDKCALLCHNCHAEIHYKLGIEE